MNRTARTILVYLAVIFVVVIGFQIVFNQANEPRELSLTEFEGYLAQGAVDDDVVMRDKSSELVGTMRLKSKPALS